MPTIKFTKKTIDTLPLPAKPQKLYWDAETAGLGLLVGAAGTKTFVLQKRNRRRRIGQYPAWTVEMARQEAYKRIVEMDKGKDPYEEEKRRKATQIKLQRAQEEYGARILTKGGSQKTVDEMEIKFKRHLPDWFETPLSEITTEACRARHKKITEQNGPYAANSVFRYFRGAFNYCKRAFGLTGENPCVGIDWNKERRRQEPISWKNLPAWKIQVEKQAPIRRDFFYTVLFTGLRSTDAAEIRWTDIDFETAILHRPCPKGGTDRAFDVPLSIFLVDILRRRKVENKDDGGLVFPARSAEEKKPVPIHRARRRWGPSRGQTPHRLRDTYTTACAEVGIHQYDIEALTNHRSPGSSVTAGYVRQDPLHLRQCQEKVTTFLLDKLSQ